MTRRGHASGFTVSTGHQDPPADRPSDWEAAARLGTTLGVLMGAARVAHIAEQLMAGGLAADTPVAAIESATTPHQRVKRTTLGELPSLPVLAPAVLVIGTVAALNVTDSGLSDLVTQLADDNGGVKWHN